MRKQNQNATEKWVSCMKRKNTTNASDATKTRFPRRGKDQEDLVSMCISLLVFIELLVLANVTFTLAWSFAPTFPPVISTLSSSFLPSPAPPPLRFPLPSLKTHSLPSSTSPLVLLCAPDPIRPTSNLPSNSKPISPPTALTPNLPSSTPSSTSRSGGQKRSSKNSTSPSSASCRRHGVGRVESPGQSVQLG
ncbi:hypothetical protein CMV_025417 [Castanea mollissima]|uniref:Uncharacterized protein n=1 Tax=Castanea mollissima TaxID=60419 RepID=A0A8J4QEJ4_9ROSI|nr:hypothetical protein CMV_025417 [Castanea mollissima]